MKTDNDTAPYVSDLFLSTISECKMPVLKQASESPRPRRQQSPSTTLKLPDERVKESLVHMKSLAQSLLCSATCVAAHNDLVVQQVHSFLVEDGDGDDDNDNEGVEIEEESLLRKDYGIYRV